MNTQGAISYTFGDATAPVGGGPVIIAHVCNDIGGWGAGFVRSLSNRWKQPEAEYRRWFRDAPAADLPNFILGEVQFVQVSEDTWIANMIGQRGIARNRSSNRQPPVRYEAIDQTLAKVAAHALEHKASVHMPRIGCGLAGGKWELIEPLVLTHLCQRGITVTVYDFQAP